MRYIFIFFKFASPLFFLVLFFSPSNAFSATRSLSIGLSGSDVAALQTKLIAKGYLAPGKNTGYFGSLTQVAVKKFQCDNGVACTNTTLAGYGVYGPRTQAILSGGNSSMNISRDSVALKPLEFSGWIPYWRSATGTRDVSPHLAQLTSVMPFGYTMKKDGTLADTAKITEEPWASFIAEAKKNKVRVIPTVMWGDGDTIHKILSNSATRTALEDEIVSMVKQNSFDGVDIDFEAKKHETMEYFSLFLEGLYKKMGNKLVYCTVEARTPLSHRYNPGAVIPADAQDFANDYAEMNKYCDRVEIMAYDQGTIDLMLNKARIAPYAPIADPAWVENLVILAAKSIDKKKIIIGVPTYGYEYEITPIPGDGYRYKVLWPFNFKYATDIAGKLGIAPVRTSANEIGFSYNPEALIAVTPTGNDATRTQQKIAPTSIVQNAGSQATASQPFNYLSWSDAQAVADKVALARKLGVRGVAVFKFDGGEDQKIWDVLK